MGRHSDADGNGVADFAEQHPYDESAAVPRRGLPASSGLTAATLRTAMGATLSLDRYTALLPAFTSLLVQVGATTVNRAAMVAAQCGHESVGLKYAREIWGPNAQQLKYDPASGSSLSKQLGNTQRGDGYTYRGAGWLQVTGRGNFSTVSKWAYARGLVPTPTYFVDHPDELGSDRYVWIGPCWYWLAARPTLNALADVGDIAGCTRLVNGGLTGVADRTARFNACLKLGTALLPATFPAPQETDMTPEESARLARIEGALAIVIQQLCGEKATITNPWPGKAGGGGWQTMRDKTEVSDRLTLVDYVRTIERGVHDLGK